MSAVSTDRKRRLWGTTIAVGAIAIVVNIPWFNALFVSFRSDGDISRGATVIGTPTTEEASRCAERARERARPWEAFMSMGRELAQQLRRKRGRVDIRAAHHHAHALPIEPFT